jgi:hypothetical protein
MFWPVQRVGSRETPLACARRDGKGEMCMPEIACRIPIPHLVYGASPHLSEIHLWHHGCVSRNLDSDEVIPVFSYGRPHA